MRNRTAVLIGIAMTLFGSGILRAAAQTSVVEEQIELPDMTHGMTEGGVPIPDNPQKCDGCGHCVHNLEALGKGDDSEDVDWVMPEPSLFELGALGVRCWYEGWRTGFNNADVSAAMEPASITTLAQAMADGATIRGWTRTVNRTFSDCHCTCKPNDDHDCGGPFLKYCTVQYKLTAKGVTMANERRLETENEIKATLKKVLPKAMKSATGKSEKKKGKNDKGGDDQDSSGGEAGVEGTHKETATSTRAQTADFPIQMYLHTHTPAKCVCCKKKWFYTHVEPTDRTVAIPEVLGQPVIDDLTAHATDFGVVVTSIATHPDAKTITLELVDPTQDAFGNVATYVAVNKENPTTSPRKDLAKLESDSDGKSVVTFDAKELGLQGIRGVLASRIRPPDAEGKDTPSTIHYVKWVDSHSLPTEPSKIDGALSITAADGSAVPSLIADNAGQTVSLAIHGNLEGKSIGLGERTDSGVVPFAAFRPTLKITQRNEARTIVRQSFVGSFQGDPRKFAALDPKITVVGELAEDGKTFVPGSVEDLNDAIGAALPRSSYGKPTPVLTATPAQANKGDKIHVGSDGRDGKKVAVHTTGLSEEIVRNHVEVVIFHKGQEKASGLDEASFDDIAEQAGEVREYSSTLRFRDKAAIPAELDAYEKKVLEESALDLKTVRSLWRVAAANFKQRIATAKNRYK